MVALELNDNEESYLWLIDQPRKKNSFIEEVLSWKDSPFKEIKIISHKESELIKKLSRNKSLIALSNDISLINPAHIYTGNDRRIEFQYIMHSTSINGSVGHYIDDGTYSYIGKPKKWFSDFIVNNTLKKLFYGFWWKQPLNIGASQWITYCHLAFPDFANKELQNKDIKELPKNLTNNTFRTLSNCCIKESNSLSDIDTLAILPHSSVASDRITKRIITDTNKGTKSALKNHPRNSEITYIENITTTLEASIPMEIYLPLLPDKCKIFGDVSTALLTAKWLRPELSVTAYYIEETEILALMRSIGITTLHIDKVEK
jgi:hypothetical protein